MWNTILVMGSEVTVKICLYHKRELCESQPCTNNHSFTHPYFITLSAKQTGWLMAISIIYFVVQSHSDKLHEILRTEQELLTGMSRVDLNALTNAVKNWKQEICVLSRLCSNFLSPLLIFQWPTIWY